MKIKKYIIKTPLVNHSCYIPHIVEHCVGTNGMGMEDFLNREYLCEGSQTNIQACYEFASFVPEKFVIEKLTQKLSVEKIKHEKKILDSELKNGSSRKKLIQKIGMNIRKNFNYNKKEKIDINDCLQYHQKYYIPQNIIVTDEDKIPYKEIIGKPGISTKTTYKTFLLNHEKITYKVLLQKISHREHYVENNLFYHMLTVLAEYQARYKDSNYYYEFPDRIHFPGYIAIILENNMSLSFEDYDKLYENLILLVKNGRRSHMQLYNYLMTGYYPSIQEMISCLKKYKLNHPMMKLLG